SMPEAFVRRQISGEELYRNVTAPLPVRVYGADDVNTPEVQQAIKAVAAQRDPAPRNGLAKELFAFDLAAARSGQLAHPHEEQEKRLLDISERLDLRGPEIDHLHYAALAELRKQAGDAALTYLKGMTMTVIDGDFPREVIAQDNLQFISYTIPAEENTAMKYDAVQALRADMSTAGGGVIGRPVPGTNPAIPRSGIRVQDDAPTLPDYPPAGSESTTYRHDTPKSDTTLVAVLVSTASVFLGLGVVLLMRRRGAAAAAMLLAAGVIFGVGAQQTALAQDNEADEIVKLIDQLGDKDTSAKALDALVKKGAKAADHLLGEAEEGQDAVKRGWSIVALGEIGGTDAEQRLTLLYKNEKQNMLVRTWAAAAVVKMKRTMDELTGMCELISTFPALGRPLGMRIVGMLNANLEGNSVEKLLRASMRIPQLQTALARPILSLGPKPLVQVMQKGADNEVRRQAAGYLAALGQQGGDDQKDTAAATIEAYNFDADAKVHPWTGGALFLPGMQWQKEQAAALVRNLIQWHLWLDRNGQQAEQQQINNNLRSIGLIRVAGLGWPQSEDTMGWLRLWAGGPAGKADVKKILEAQGVANDPKYKAAAE
ncbi:MAG: hypothetical protein AB7S36_15415, partial [Planctomycetota bacterium]